VIGEHHRGPHDFTLASVTARSRPLRDLLPEPGNRTLDLGCGEGRLSRFPRSLGHRVAGADASPTMVRLAAGHENPASAVLADAAALPFRDATLDLVVAYVPARH